MNKRGQLEHLGIILVVFIAIIIGVALFLVIAQEVGDSTTTEYITNYSLTTGGSAGGTITITEYKSLTGVTIMNMTGNALLNSGNYSIANNQVTDGDLSVVITIDADVTEPVDTTWLLNGTAQRLDYIDDSATRSIAGLIAIFFALAIAVIAIAPTIKGPLGDMLKV